MRIRIWFFIALGFALWGAVNGAGVHIWYTAAGMPAPWLPFMLNYVLSWLFWPLCIPLIKSAGRRFNLHRGPYVPALSIHLLLSVILALSQTLFFVFNGVGLWMWLGEWDFAGAWGLYNMPGLLYQRIPATVPVYWMILAAYYAWEYYRESRQREKRSLQLQNQLSRTRLQALESQLQPHFLFNALHAIISLIQEKQNKEASSMVMGLSDLLRQRLSVVDGHEVTLRQEMEHVETYLDMVRVRHGDRLNIVTAMAEDTLAAMVPTFLLQPLVENAVTYGVEKHAGHHTIHMASAQERNVLQIEIINTGAAPDANEWSESGMGLSNSRDRLSTLYGDQYELELSGIAEDRVRLRLQIPFHTTPVAFDGGGV